MVIHKTKECEKCKKIYRLKSILSCNGHNICKKCNLKLNSIKAARLADRRARQAYWAKKKSLFKDTDKNFLKAKYNSNHLSEKEKAIRIRNLQKIVEANKKLAEANKPKPTFKEEFSKLTAKRKRPVGVG